MEDLPIMKELPIMKDLPIMYKTYKLIIWYVPILNRLPKNHKFGLGDRIVNRLYDLMEGLSEARYDNDKLEKLKRLNAKVDILRIFTWLLFDLDVFDQDKVRCAGRQINEIGCGLGGWIKQQQNIKKGQ
ncbi:hypothetical protein NIES4071_56780 [Calothrix sp. NIES-4071]|nr:hypothetical protein NIES4071_56780 [Calothrix sp. NIES-4071]BAZ59985.1 hypothetical protein NIES4105_56730 [Calothrix sp. NIES-4105]